MSELVEWLRAHGKYDYGAGRCLDAADTIDRLTRELAEARAELDDQSKRKDNYILMLEKAERERDEARAETARLEQVFTEQFDSNSDLIRNLLVERDTARQALAAAREALQEIASIERTQLQEGNCGQEPEYECYWSMVNRAREIARSAIAALEAEGGETCPDCHGSGLGAAAKTPEGDLVDYDCPTCRGGGHRKPSPTEEQVERAKLLKDMAHLEGVDPRYMCHILTTRPGGADYMQARYQRSKGDAS